jgi:hypothetical protein
VGGPGHVPGLGDGSEVAEGGEFHGGSLPAESGGDRWVPASESRTNRRKAGLC